VSFISELGISKRHNIVTIKFGSASNELFSREIAIKIICDGFLVLCESSSIAGDITWQRVSSLGIKM
jgi:hypothetical protein